MQSLTRSLRLQALRQSTVQRTITPSVLRPFSQTRIPAARKDAQGKDDMKVEPNEYSKSGSDNAAAAVEETAFSPDKTSPEEQHASAGKESEKESNPLDVSPANHDVSQPRGGQEGGHEGSSAQSGQGNSDRARTSGGSSGGSGGKKGQGQRYS